jgi:AcrR family transcriptional regulator
MTPERRRAHLLDAAAELAAGRGLAALSVEEIAAHAGVSEGLLYHYFPTKQALLVAAVRRAADAMRAALDVAAHGAPLESLTAGLAAYLDHVQADPTGWRALLQARTGDLAEIAADVDEHSRRLLLLQIGVAQPSPVLSTVLDGWTALERQVCLGWLERPTVARAAVEDLLVSTFLQAMEAGARHDEQMREVVTRLLGTVGP